ncbi:epsin-1 [Pseudozyma hubeiensis SY62]|uniref:Epsin-1 n=1 Tax=Pseudozyma hubeiensis (strain SY62) TaxID=1305764 RepID=R9NXM2_PSEHS|nr:epsin-1 [Pseudozyma hubeiensis SY62]GAC93312.1 epsin-1 [Pseudozyma hubeiensis SY62]
MDDEVDFFTRKPLPGRSKLKSKARPLAKVASTSSVKLTTISNDFIAHPASSASPTVVSSSQSATTAPLHIDNSDDEGTTITIMDTMEEDDDDDEQTIMYSSDVDIASDDSHASEKRRAKRRKKKHVKTLPAWASQGVFRRPSQDPSSSLSDPSSFDVRSDLTGDDVKSTQATSSGKMASNATPQKDKAKSNGRQRGVSLTPPPAPSPEKLKMARELVNTTIAKKFGNPNPSAATASSSAALSSSNDSSSRRVTRSTRSSATPAFGQDVPSNNSSTLSPGSSKHVDEDDVDTNGSIHWDPDLARLMRGENAKHIREQARREQQERDERRKQREQERQRQQPASSQRSTQSSSRTQSAPQLPTTTARPAANGVDGSDDEVQFVPRPPRRLSSSPRRTRSSTTTASTSNVDAIVIQDSDDEEPTPTKPNGTSFSAAAGAARDSPSPSPSAPPAGETLSLTLQSKLGSMPVTVTPTTLLSRIISHFHSTKLSTSNVPPTAVKITFDGFAYKPTQTVQDMDVEDGDQVELTWT